MGVDNLFTLLTSPPTTPPPSPPSPLPPTPTITDLLQRTVISLIQSSSRPPWKPTRELSDRIAWRARCACRNLLVCFRTMVVSSYSMRTQRTLVTEDFTKRFLKSLAATYKGTERSRTLKVLITVYGDIAHLLPCALHYPTPITPPTNETIRLFAHPLIPLKHILIPILRACTWQPQLASHGSDVISRLGTYLKKYAATLPTAMDDSDADVRGMVEHVAEFCGVLAEFLARRGSRDSDDDAPPPGFTSHSGLSVEKQPVKLDTSTPHSLVQWCLQRHTARMCQMFLLPLLEQLCGGEANWASGKAVVCEVFYGKVGVGGSAGGRRRIFTFANENDPTVRSVMRWLVGTACDRGLSNGSGGGGDDGAQHTRLARKLPVRGAGTKVRLFAIGVLGGLPCWGDQISTTLLSLFDDPSLDIRTGVARAMALRVLNLGVESGGRGVGEVDVGDVHREECRCDDRGGASLMGTWESNPFRRVLEWVEKLGGGEGRRPSTTPTKHHPTPADHQTFTFWTSHLTTHILTCPISSPATSHTLLSRFAREVLSRLSSPSLSPLSHSSHFPLLAASVVVGCLEGFSCDGAKGGVWCDPKVLRCFAGVLWRLRRWGDVDVRRKVLEGLEGVVGVGRGGGEDSDLDYETLSIAYRLVRGEEPFLSVGSSTAGLRLDDGMERHVEGVRGRILKWGAARHLVALYLRVGEGRRVGREERGDKWEEGQRGWSRSDDGGGERVDVGVDVPNLEERRRSLKEGGTEVLHPERFLEEAFEEVERGGGVGVEGASGRGGGFVLGRSGLERAGVDLGRGVVGGRSEEGGGFGMGSVLRDRNDETLLEARHTSQPELMTEQQSPPTTIGRGSMLRTSTPEPGGLMRMSTPEPGRGMATSAPEPGRLMRTSTPEPGRGVTSMSTTKFTPVADSDTSPARRLFPTAATTDAAMQIDELHTVTVGDELSRVGLLDGFWVAGGGGVEGRRIGLEGGSGGGGREEAGSRRGLGKDDGLEGEGTLVDRGGDVVVPEGNVDEEEGEGKTAEGDEEEKENRPSDSIRVSTYAKPDRSINFGSVMGRYSFTHSTYPPVVMRTRLKKGIARVLKGLVFDGDGAHDAAGDTGEKDSHPPLHPLLAKIFTLEPSLLLECCEGLDFPDSLTWEEGLGLVGRRLVGVSRALRGVEGVCKGRLELAQGVVVVRDQIFLGRVGRRGGGGGGEGGGFVRWVCGGV
ncbi:hypothetical protein HDV00_002175 [Rhizophlyctis rosea]|nr:hypothetical protein HDV00_002175 [Rhizophlyctis rosea]